MSSRLMSSRLTIPGQTRPVRSAATRWLVTTSLLVLALVMQVSVLPHLTPQALGHGVVPNLCLLVVVAVAMGRGADEAAVLGFVAGLLLDLAPPADHVAGRWALALVVVGYVAGRVRPDPRTDPAGGPSATTVMATVAAGSFVATSIFAISGLLLRDPVVSIPDVLPVIGLAVVCDVLVAPLVLPALMRISGDEQARVPV